MVLDFNKLRLVGAFEWRAASRAKKKRHRRRRRAHAERDAERCERIEVFARQLPLDQMRPEGIGPSVAPAPTRSLA